MSEYIEREIVINDIDNIIEILNKPPIGKIDKKLLETFELWKQRFLETPTADVVEVVRCEKCRFACFQYNTDKYPFGVYACKKQPTGRAYKKVKGSHFCSYGELKECEGK